MPTSILRSLGPRFGCRRATTTLTARAWYEQGIRAEADGDLPAARKAYGRALERDPGMTDASCNLGRLLHEAGEVAAAERCYRVARDGAPDVAVHWFNLGVALEDQGQRDEAIECYLGAIERDARLADAHFNLARLYEVGARDDLHAAYSAIRHWLAYRALKKTA